MLRIGTYCLNDYYIEDDFYFNYYEVLFKDELEVKDAILLKLKITLIDYRTRNVKKIKNIKSILNDYFNMDSIEEINKEELEYLFYKIVSNATLGEVIVNLDERNKIEEIAGKQTILKPTILVFKLLIKLVIDKCEVGQDEKDEYEFINKYKMVLNKAVLNLFNLISDVFFEEKRCKLKLSYNIDNAEYLKSLYYHLLAIKFYKKDDLASALYFSTKALKDYEDNLIEDKMLSVIGLTVDIKNRLGLYAESCDCCKVYFLFYWATRTDITILKERYYYALFQLQEYADLSDLIVNFSKFECIDIFYLFIAKTASKKYLELEEVYNLLKLKDKNDEYYKAIKEIYEVYLTNSIQFKRERMRLINIFLQKITENTELIF